MIWCIMKRLKVLFTAFTQKRLERKAYRKLKKLERFCYDKKHDSLFETLHFASMFENKRKEWERYKTTAENLKVRFLRLFIASIDLSK